MAILGSPKPAQSRFYLGGARGRPQQDGQEKEEAGYARGKFLRGRKTFYPHKNFSASTVFPNGMARGNQNRSIRNWIPAGKEFRFTIRFENLTKLELGGLLWLLVFLGEQGRGFRLGYGKPLGLGSVMLKADVEGIKICTGDEMKKRYETLNGGISLVPPDECKALHSRFMKILYERYPEEKDKADSLCNGLYTAAKEVGPVAYSVIDEKPDASSFEWFVENERPIEGRRRSLPYLGKPLQSYPQR